MSRPVFPRPRRVVFALAALAVAALASCGGSVPSLDGADYQALLQSHRGHPVLVLFWATWCHSCKRELPVIEELLQSMGEDELAVVALSLDDDPGEVRRFLEENPLPFPVYMADKEITLARHVDMVPTVIVYDAEGQERFNRSGVFPLPMLRGMVAPEQ